MALRPLTCACPVMPGRTKWRLACSWLYNGKYSMSSGRGPTMLISPLMTFQSSGISSRLLERSILPNGVSRSLSGKGLPCASTASFMLRNLIISNGLPCKPGRT